jgi:3-oxoacyl-[acyl-carrier protein] reductase
MVKTIFITGSSSGIGKAIAYSFAKEGWNIISTYHSNKNEGKSTEKECSNLGAASTLLLKLDVLSDKSIKDAFKAIKKKYKTIDVLVNNAGVIVYEPFKEYKYKDIEWELRTDLEAPLKITHTFLPIIKQSVVNISSVLGYSVATNVSGYCAAKWGLRGFTKAFANEHPELLTFAVNPGWTATKMTEQRGIQPSKVANLIFEVISGARKVENGGDLNIADFYPETLHQ